MDVALATGLIAARTAELQFAVAAKMLRMRADNTRAVADMIDAAQRNMQRLAETARGVGQSLDITV